MQLANIIIIGVFFIGSLVGLVGIGFSQIMETITSGGISDDGYPFIALLVGTIFLLIYLIYAIKFYIRSMKSNSFVLTACWFNVAMIILSLLGTIVVVISRDGFAALFVGIILIFVALPLFISSFILFMIGKKKSSILINANQIIV